MKQTTIEAKKTDKKLVLVKNTTKNFGIKSAIKAGVHCRVSS